MTNDVWSIGLPVLICQNKGFDLAVFAVSTQRLALSENDFKFLNLSLDAYSTVLQIHRQLLDSSRPSPILAAMSALLMFFEAAQPNGSDSARRVAHQSHFRGTIALMEACGLEHFQAPGHHDIFKKLRDMEASLSFRAHLAALNLNFGKFL